MLGYVREIQLHVHPLTCLTDLILCRSHLETTQLAVVQMCFVSLFHLKRLVTFCSLTEQTVLMINGFYFRLCVLINSGGAGGKGVWGAAGMVYEVEEPDVRDPNYDESAQVSVAL